MRLCSSLNFCGRIISDCLSSFMSSNAFNLSNFTRQGRWKNLVWLQLCENTYWSFDSLIFPEMWWTTFPSYPECMALSTKTIVNGVYKNIIITTYIFTYILYHIYSSSAFCFLYSPTDVKELSYKLRNLKASHKVE